MECSYRKLSSGHTLPAQSQINPAPTHPPNRAPTKPSTDSPTAPAKSPRLQYLGPAVGAKPASPYRRHIRGVHPYKTARGKPTLRVEQTLAMSIGRPPADPCQTRGVRSAIGRRRTANGDDNQPCQTREVRLGLAPAWGKPFLTRFQSMNLLKRDRAVFTGHLTSVGETCRQVACHSSQFGTAMLRCAGAAASANSGRGGS
jgi:hypothetical protein